MEVLVQKRLDYHALCPSQKYELRYDVYNKPQRTCDTTMPSVCIIASEREFCHSSIPGRTHARKLPHQNWQAKIPVTWSNWPVDWISRWIKLLLDLVHKLQGLKCRTIHLVNKSKYWQLSHSAYLHDAQTGDSRSNKKRNSLVVTLWQKQPQNSRSM
jgi:hypothetical protein